jgi:5-methylcytosine-specific restriction enzyme A
MPTKAPAACKRSGCPGLVRDGVCSVCGPLRAAVQRQHDEQRGSAAQRGYGARWQRLRGMVLRGSPLCAECARQGIVTPATDVHHLVKRRDGGPDAEGNLEALCHACHSRITAQGG